MRYLLAFYIFTGAPLVFASSENYQITFGPYVGAGSISSSATVRHASGYSVAIDRSFGFTKNFSLGPKFEFTNGFLNTRDKVHGTKSIGHYDNRIFAAGVIGTARFRDRGLVQNVYLNGMLGQSYSKLTVDSSSEKQFTQNLYGNIKGRYLAAEIGTFIPLKNAFGLNIAVRSTMIRADQTEAGGTFDGTAIDESNTTLNLKGSHEPGSLPNQTIVMKTVAAKIALSLGF